MKFDKSQTTRGLNLQHYMNMSEMYMEFSGKEHFEPYEPLRIPTNNSNKTKETTSEVVGPESVNKTEKTATNHPNDPL
jgi:hypothetical protein